MTNSSPDPDSIPSNDPREAQRIAQRNAQQDAQRKLGPEKYARLRAEAKAPYRGFRKFVYGAIAASGGIGAFVFLTQIAAGRDVGAALPNFAFQVGLVALMIWLFRLEKRD